MDIFLGHHKIGLYLGVIFMHFRVSSLGQGTESGYFFRLLKFQIFLLLIFFGVNGICWMLGPSLHMKKR